MNFCIYADCEITVKNKYCYINEEGDHKTEIEEFTKIMDGGKLAKFIAELLNDREFSSIRIMGDQIIISLFDPMDGTGQDILITVKELNEK